MIYLENGALLDKELEPTDYADGRKYGPKLRWLMTFHPCRVCKAPECRKTTYKECNELYFELWAEKFLNGGQLTLEAFA
jgi:hypothetical protein